MSRRPRGLGRDQKLHHLLCKIMRGQALIQTGVAGQYMLFGLQWRLILGLWWGVREFYGKSCQGLF